MTAPSFAKDIRPLFSSRDIQSMKSVAGFDLSSLNDVKAHADKIYLRLSTKTMPPDQPWPDDQIARFKAWLDGGMTP